MRKIVVNEFMSLDGVVQSPGYPDEDPSGGFKHGGWHMPYMDEESMNWVMGGILEAGGFILGRRTYEIFARYWPNAPEEQQTVARPINTLPKYVASRTLTEPLQWENSRLLQGGVSEAVQRLKEEGGKDLQVIGSTELVRTLMDSRLIDEFRLMIDPLFLGGGKRFFSEDDALRPLRLVASKVTTTGAVLATYAPTDDAPSRETRKMADVVSSQARV
jgi:dihydrofolate reductase